VPLALGVLLLPVPLLVLARVAGSLVAMVMQRTSAEKLTYNISAFAFEAAVTSTLCKFVVTGLDPVSMLILILCVAAIDQVMTALVLLVIRMHGITMPRRDVWQVLVQSIVLSAVATAFAVTLRILIMRGATGYSLAVVLIAVAVLGYRMYAATVQRHHTTTTVHDFVTSSAATASMADLAASSLTRIRNMLRASAAELAVLDGDTDGDTTSWTVYCVDEDDRLSVRRGAPTAADWVRMRALHNGIATLAVRGRDTGIDAWLDGAGPDSGRLDDAIVVPVHNGATRFGTLTVSGRLTDVVVFTEDDVQVLQTLGGHLAASMQNARLLETLSYDATHDALTGLANRSQLINDLGTLGDESAALLVVDLDHFKDVNDVLGHEVADELLAVVAQRLGRVVPTARTVARVGGDEFAVLLHGSESECDLAARAHALAKEISEPLQLHGATVSVSVSTGVAATPTVRAHDLMRCADTAMYVAKARTDRLAIYSPAMDLGRAERIALAADLRLALEHAPEQFVIYLQPKVDLRSGRTHGAEALARWNHPTHGLITPDRFVPIAEATGLIAPLTRHVLRQALVECAKWTAAGHGIDVAVNLSARLVADLDVVEMVQAALVAASVPASRLVLEITESVLMNDAECAIATLQRVADLGVRISLDDFGTGYSSLSYLQRLPAYELKIDRSFVAAVDTDSSRTLALLRNVTKLGLDLGMQLVAEGIETAAQGAALEALGCTLGQGFHYARPMPAEQFRTWLQHDQETGLRLVPSA
jgi:diguanylate cyclase (GGDEF)-like protein